MKRSKDIYPIVSNVPIGPTLKEQRDRSILLSMQKLIELGKNPSQAAEKLASKEQYRTLEGYTHLKAKTLLNIWSTNQKRD